MGSLCFKRSGGNQFVVDKLGYNLGIRSSRVVVRVYPRELRSRGRAEGTLNVMLRHVNWSGHREASPQLDKAVGEGARGYESGALIRGRQVTVRRRVPANVYAFGGVDSPIPVTKLIGGKMAEKTIPSYLISRSCAIWKAGAIGEGCRWVLNTPSRRLRL